MSRHEQKIARHVRQGLKGTPVTFMTIDESNKIDAKVLAVLGRKMGKTAALAAMFGAAKLPPKPRRRKFKAMDVACSKCGAGPGEHCSPRRRPVHSERWWDVQAVQDAYDTLLEVEQ